MTNTPTHYELRINRSVELLGIMFKPDAEHLVTAAIYEKFRQTAADAIVSAVPVSME